MKNTLKLSTLALLVASVNAYAHHPAEDMVDPDVYAMIEENISDVHLAMTFDDMGGSSTEAAMGASDDAGNMASEMAAEMASEMGSDLASVGAEMESREQMASIADVEPAGQMGSQR